MSDLRSKYVDALSGKIASNIDSLLLQGLPKHFDVHKLSCIRSPNVEVFSYDGKPFLELHDPEYRTTFDGSRHIVTVTQRFRHLSSNPHHDIPPTDKEQYHKSGE